MSIIVAGQVVPTPAQLALDIELFHAHLETLAKDDVRGHGVCRSEAMQKSDLYKRCVRTQYKRIPELRQKEKQFLVDFFMAMKGHSFKVKFGWVGQKKTISKPELKVLAAHGSQFFGVTASADRLQGLDLAGNGCKGVLPSSLGSINDCKLLKLNWNRISGVIPKGLSKLTELQTLHLFSNALEGGLDFQTISGLSNLRSLNLSFNKLSGTVPDAFENSVHLQEINLSGNKFRGELPDSMQHLRELRILKLYNNEFSGELPAWLESLNKLEDVNLSQNKFSGTLDPFMGCSELRHLILCHNQIQGSISAQIAQLQHLEIFYCSYNQLTGKVPGSICALSCLSKLNLSNNNLSGVLPAAFGDLQSLETCILGCNLLSGPAPLSLSKLKKLRDFELFTAAPSETLYIPRAFEAHTFQRVFEWGPSVGLNNVHWEDEDGAEQASLPLSVDVLESAAVAQDPTGAARPETGDEPFSPSISRWLSEKDRNEIVSADSNVSRKGDVS